MPIDVSGRKNVAQLKKEGYDVTYHEHEGGHGTPREMMRESICGSWVKSCSDTNSPGEH